MEEQLNKLAVVTEWPLGPGWESDFLARTLLREGISEKQITYFSLLERRPSGGHIHAVGEEALAGFEENLRQTVRLGHWKAVLTLGDSPTRALGGTSGIDKWHCSPLWRDGSCIVPALPMQRVFIDLSQQVWLIIAARKVARALRGELKEQTHVHYLNPPLEEALGILESLRDRQQVALDIETGRGQINTVGFAWSATEGVAINTLPDRLSGANYSRLWSVIRDVVESDQPKLLQNFIYETLYFSRYGIRLRGVTHDTMICQKFLWPELEMGLDAIGRMYTDMPYWKDDNKDWSNIRDWQKHYEYNCKDTTGTFAGYLGQTADLDQRGLRDVYFGYIARLFPAVAEMCSRGLPVSERALRSLQSKVDGEYTAVLADLRKLPGAERLNPRSHAQVKSFLSSPPRKYKLPKKRDSATKTWKDSSDEKSLKKLRVKYPEDPALPALLRLAKLGKIISSYLSFGYDPDGRMRYQIIAGATETMRMAGYCDPWDRGVNPQTIPGGTKGINVKQIFHAEPGHSFLQCDLAQAESRFVAYDAPDLGLIRVLEDPTKDIHSMVAVEICQQWGKDPVAEQALPTWKKTWRQLGKKSGHGANYGEQENTLIDTCLSELDIVLTKSEANKVLEAYHTLFPGIRRWHKNIREEVVLRRKLTTPWGWERQFFGRMNDDTFREAYAFRPQATIPYLINQLMLHLLAQRGRGLLDFRLLLQGHDSLLLEVPDRALAEVTATCNDLSSWQPGFDLAGGHLVIPVEVATGKIWGDL